MWLRSKHAWIAMIPPPFTNWMQEDKILSALNLLCFVYKIGKTAAMYGMTQGLQQAVSHNDPSKKGLQMSTKRMGARRKHFCTLLGHFPSWINLIAFPGLCFEEIDVSVHFGFIVCVFSSSFLLSCKLRKLNTQGQFSASASVLAQVLQLVVVMAMATVKTPQWWGWVPTLFRVGRVQ